MEKEKYYLCVPISTMRNSRQFYEDLKNIDKSFKMLQEQMKDSIIVSPHQIFKQKFLEGKRMSDLESLAIRFKLIRKCKVLVVCSYGEKYSPEMVYEHDYAEIKHLPIIYSKIRRV